MNSQCVSLDLFWCAYPDGSIQSSVLGFLIGFLTFVGVTYIFWWRHVMKETPDYNYVQKEHTKTEYYMILAGVLLIFYLSFNGIVLLFTLPLEQYDTYALYCFFYGPIPALIFFGVKAIPNWIKIFKKQGHCT